MIMKTSVFCCMTPCSSLNVNRLFGGKFYLHLQGRRRIQARNQHKAELYMLHIPEDLQKSGDCRKPKVTRVSVRRSTCVLTSMSQRVDPCKFQESRKADLCLLRLARPLVKIDGDSRHIKEHNRTGLQASVKISFYTRVRFSTLTS